jgi:hypothetical protein
MRVEVHWRKISCEEASEDQKRAWRWLWRELLKPVGESCCPQLETGDNSVSNRRDSGGLIETEGLHNDSANPATSSSELG